MPNKHLHDGDKATQAEAVAGTSDDKYITPVTAKAVSAGNSLGAFIHDVTVSGDGTLVHILADSNRGLRDIRDTQGLENTELPYALSSLDGSEWEVGTASLQVTGGGDFSLTRGGSLMGGTITRIKGTAGTDGRVNFTDSAAILYIGYVIDGEELGGGIDISGTGIVAHHDGTFVTRTIIGGTGITVSNGTGQTNNPVVSITQATISTAQSGTSTTVVMTPGRTTNHHEHRVQIATFGPSGNFPNKTIWLEVD